MHEALDHHLPVRAVHRGRDSALFPLGAVAMMVFAAIALFILIFGIEYSPVDLERPYLIPWVLATGVVIVVPCMVLRSRGELKFTNPLVFATLTYFFPMFFIGGWSLTIGLSNYHFLNYVTDPEYTFPLTFVYIMLGFAGLAVGYLIPKARSIGIYISKKLPVWDFTPTEMVVSCTFCLVAGFCLNVIALEMGQIGYQTGDIVFGETGSLASYLAFVLPTSSFLLWVAFFKFEKWNFLHLVIIAAQSITAIFMLVVQGGKSSLLYFAVLAIGAFVLVKGKIEFRHWALFASVLAVCLILGTFYGSKFRELKGTANRVSVTEYGSLAFESIEKVGSAEPVAQLTASGSLLADRLEIVSSLAVVVANYEALAPYETAYGLDNNIWTYTLTSFIPRILWKDKPIIADGFSYNELYFDNGGSGLSITAMGDLLRNFGPIGVPVGMIVLGFGIRIFYSALVEGQPFSFWKMAVYFIVISKLPYDGFYGEILPTVIRITVVIVAQFLVFRIVTQFLRSVRG